MAKFRQQWCVLYTRPRYESKVTDELKNKGVACLLPKTRAVRNYKTQKRIVELPMFPSYVFVRPGNLNEYYLGLDLKGVLGYVKFGSEIAYVSNRVIENLEILNRKSPWVEVVEAKIEKGDPIIIAEGPLTGLICEMVEYRGGRKALIRVNQLKSNILIDINTHKLKKIPGNELVSSGD